MGEPDTITIWVVCQHTIDTKMMLTLVRMRHRIFFCVRNLQSFTEELIEIKVQRNMQTLESGKVVERGVD